MNLLQAILAITMGAFGWYAWSQAPIGTLIPFLSIGIESAFFGIFVAVMMIWVFNGRDPNDPEIHVAHKDFPLPR